MVRLLLSHARPELARLSAWLDEQERVLAMSERVAYAVRLCLEEAVANLIDHAPATSDIAVDLGWPGGLGIVLMRSFASDIDYRTAAGCNRLTLRFSGVGPD